MRKIEKVTRSLLKKALALGLAGLVVIISTLTAMPEPVYAQAVLEYPALPSGVQYYQTTYPTGLRYSEGWYGTFTNAPTASQVILFDDDWSKDWGIAIFSLPVGVSPTGTQGGTSVLAITRAEADVIIKSYTLDESFKPFDAEIEAVMDADHFFNGVWAGEKLEQKWRGPSLLPRPPPDQLTDRQKEYIEDTKDLDIKQVDLTKYDPPRYWVGDGGNWSDNANHWSASTGGAPGASLPTNADSVYFDANSFTAGSQTVALDVIAVSLDMDWTGATDSPTLDLSANKLRVHGSLTFIGAMTVSGVQGLEMKSTASGKTITTGGVTVDGTFVFDGSGGEWTLQDALNTGTFDVYVKAGTVDTNGKTITCQRFIRQGSGTKVLTLGASVINISGTGGNGWFDNTATNFTLNANTSTFKLTGTGNFDGAGLTYYNVELNGSAHTISGSNTFNTLTFQADTTQTVTFTDGTTQTITTPTITGSVGNAKTLQGSGAGGWNITKVGGGTVILDYMSISRSTAGPTDWYAGGNSTNGGNNTNWAFNDQALTFTTQLATNVTIDKENVTSGNFNGTLGGLVGTHNTSTWMDYGLTVAYGSTTTPVNRTTTGAFVVAMPDNLVPGATYHYRFSGSNDGGTYNGNDQTFTVTSGVYVGYLLLRSLLTLLIAMVTLLAVIRTTGNPAVMLGAAVVGIMAIVIIQNVLG